jgi:hypothetical protein
MIFHVTNAAKGFHSAALHCDVLAERTSQIELKQQVRLCVLPYVVFAVLLLLLLHVSLLGHPVLYLRASSTRFYLFGIHS